MDLEQLPTYVVLVPVKRWASAKTRLDTADPAHRRALMEAFALDAIDGAVQCRRVAAVYVVTAQPGFRPTGARVLPDDGAGDLNAALAAAARRVRADHPDAAIAALCADLPCLRPEELDVALEEAAGRRCFVADSAGTGTTLLAASPGDGLEPEFGPDSARRHGAGGAYAVTAPVPGLRLDVDTAADLGRATAIGVGPHTSEALLLTRRRR